MGGRRAGLGHRLRGGGLNSPQGVELAKMTWVLLLFSSRDEKKSHEEKYYSLHPLRPYLHTAALQVIPLRAHLRPKAFSITSLKPAPSCIYCDESRPLLLHLSNLGFDFFTSHAPYKFDTSVTNINTLPSYSQHGGTHARRLLRDGVSQKARFGTGYTRTCYEDAKIGHLESLSGYG